MLYFCWGFIVNATKYGIAGFLIGFILSVFTGLLSLQIFPYFLGEEKEKAQYCFSTPPFYMTYQQLIECRNIDMRENFFSTGLTVAMLATIYGFIKRKENYERKN